MFIDVFGMGKPPAGEAKTVVWVVDRDPDLLQFLEACLVRSLGSEVLALRSGRAANRGPRSNASGRAGVRTRPARRLW